jgi:hypothetical protein
LDRLLKLVQRRRPEPDRSNPIGDGVLAQLYDSNDVVKAIVFGIREQLADASPAWLDRAAGSVFSRALDRIPFENRYGSGMKGRRCDLASGRIGVSKASSPHSGGRHIFYKEPSRATRTALQAC